MRPTSRAIDAIGGRTNGTRPTPTASDRTAGATRDENDGSTPPIRADGGSTWTDLTGFQRDLLKSIRWCTRHDKTPTGQTIKEDIEARYGEPINNGRLYQNLNDLVGCDLLEKGFVDGRTNIYRLSESAHAMLDEAAYRFVDDCGMEVAVPNSGLR